MRTSFLKYPEKLSSLTEEEFRENIAKIGAATYFVTDRHDTTTSLAVGYCLASGIPVITVGHMPNKMYQGQYLKLTREEWRQNVDQFSSLGSSTELESSDEDQASVPGGAGMGDLSTPHFQGR
jgi:nucleoside 2-deoxyribosyltransferase